MKREDITEKVLYLLKNKFCISESILIEENLNKPLTGEIFNFNEVNMVYFYLEITKLFNISIPIEKIQNRGLFTINNTINTIIECQ